MKKDTEKYTYQWTAKGTRIYDGKRLIAHVYGINGGVDTAKTICQLLSKKYLDENPKINTCLHPKHKQINYHDSSILCTECDCIIEQFGEKIEPPYEL